MNYYINFILHHIVYNISLSVSQDERKRAVATYSSTMTGFGNLPPWALDREDTTAAKHSKVVSDPSSQFANSKHVRSMSESRQLPAAVAVVSPEQIRGYVHGKKVNDYLVGSTLGEGSFAKVKEALHSLVGEKVSYEGDSDRSTEKTSTVQVCMCAKQVVGGAH